MRNWLLNFVLCLLVLSACSSDPAKTIPANILSEDRMKEIYLDVFIAESAVTDLHLAQDSAKKLMQLRYQQIALKNKVDRKQMLKSMEYYFKHPIIYGEVMQTVIDSLSSMEARTK